MPQAKKIGKGAFTTAYLRNDGKVLLKSKDYIKECMAHGWFPNSRLFPRVSFGDVDNEYIMNYYPRVKSLKNTLQPKDYAFYKELRAIFLDNNCRDSNGWYKAFGAIKCPRKREIMREALNACNNYGCDIAFEISPRNVSATKAGKLVLLDCFFVRSQLNEVRSQ